MRFAVAWVTVLVLAGIGVFTWQRSQIVHLRAQVARQGEVLDDLSGRFGNDPQAANVAPRASRASLRLPPARSAYDGSAEARADERRVITDQYRDVLAQMDLPPEKASRLLELLTDRIETVLDAQDAAVREGFAEGSAQTARAVGLAIAEVDRDIIGLIGQDGIRRIDGLPAVQQSEPAVSPSPVFVTVVVQAPPAPAAYADPGVEPVAADAGAQYASYPYPYFPLYPISAVLNEPRGNHRFAGPRNGTEPRRRESVRVTYR